jgi:hypothetical protein
MLSLLLLYPAIEIQANDKALAAERHQAQKQRQADKLKRHRENTKAYTTLRHYARELEQEYAQKTHALDTEFRLKKVNLNADREIKVAEAQADMQKTLSTVYMDPTASGSPAAVEKIQSAMKQHADRLFEIKKQAAQLEHESNIDNAEKKDQLLDKKDELILQKAKELGLLTKPAPILATPIGGKLTDAEQRWNEQEKLEVEKLFKNNERQLSRYQQGSQLRQWERADMLEDFKLHWQKLQELQALEQQLAFHHTAMLMPAGTPQDHSAMATKAAELSKQRRLIEIKYKKIKNENRIKRQERKRQFQQ